ncbi:hypothetical protein FQN55_000101 [Onygenales sp. PD_40]|nr:hypothetical protein FQN55_000101 [Onygenales sp. PD_40]KAK2783246.1 hypothetical protein FQN52_000347 [Onygenales sp. PD_12]
MPIKHRCLEPPNATVFIPPLISSQPPSPTASQVTPPTISVLPQASTTASGNAKAIGIGVGVGAGVIIPIITLAAFFFWRRWKRKQREVGGEGSQKQPETPMPQDSEKGGPGANLGSDEKPLGDQRPLSELHGQHLSLVSELEGAGQLRENQDIGGDGKCDENQTGEARLSELHGQHLSIASELEGSVRQTFELE